MNITMRGEELDLFTPIVAIDKMNPNFRTILMNDSYSGERQLLQEWARDYPDRDNKFVMEFQTTFNSSLWELYVFQAFRELGFLFDWSQPSPDFMLLHNGQSFIVEATTANASQGKPNEWERELSYEAMSEIDIPKINRESTIRLSNAITSKHRKYREKYRALPHVCGRPFVIAVAPFEQPLFFHQYDRPIRSLLYDYYVDEEAWKENPDDYPNGPPGVSLGSIEKENGSEIELGFFNSDCHEEISAVIFSCFATMGKLTALSKIKNKASIFSVIRIGENGEMQPVSSVEHKDYHESIVDGLHVFHNPFAMYPIDPKHFRSPGIIQNYFDRSSCDWVLEGYAGSLAYRNVMSIRSF